MMRATAPLLALALLIALHTVTATAAPPTSAAPFTSTSWTTTLLSRLLPTTPAAATATTVAPTTPEAPAPVTKQSTAETSRRRRRGWWRRRGPFCKRSMLVCAFHGTELGGPGISGAATFESVRRGRRCAVRVRAFVRGLSHGLHGFHIHAFGDVRGADGKSAGGHFVGPWNRNAIHGWPWSKRRHWGCLGNINAGKLGAWYNRVDMRIRIGHIVGRSMIIHAGPDLGPTHQPSGGAGPRVAKCVIGYANPEYKEDL